MNERVRKQYENVINLATNFAAWKVVRKAMPGKLGVVANFVATAASTVAGVGAGNIVSDILFSEKEKKDDGTRIITVVIEREESDEE